MSNEAGEKVEDLGIFDQIDEALEERAGTDRRKQKTPPPEGEDRRKEDRREASAQSA